MLEFSPEAVQYIRDKGQPIYLEMPPVIGCCITIREKPEVRFGYPYNPENYEKQEIQGFIVYLPDDFPSVDLKVNLHSFLGIKHLGVEGWHLA